jgi:hypothetical protein
LEVGNRSRLTIGRCEVARCPSCKKEAPADAEYCPYCGKKVEAKELGPGETSLIQDEIYKCLIKEAGSAILLVLGFAFGGAAGFYDYTILAVVCFVAAALGLVSGPYYANKRQKLTQKRLKGR